MNNKEKYNLNEAALTFIIEFESGIESGVSYTNRNIVKEFKNSIYYDEIVESYYSTAMQKAIWWGIKRSGKWNILKGQYIKI